MSDRKPIISIGLLTAPVVIPNFATDEDGSNDIATDLLKLFARVLDETWDKLYEMTQQLMTEIGVEVQTVSPEIITEIMVQALKKQQDGTMQGVITQKGKVILDEQAAEQLRKGISINN